MTDELRTHDDVCMPLLEQSAMTGRPQRLEVETPVTLTHSTYTVPLKSSGSIGRRTTMRVVWKPFGLAGVETPPRRSREG